MEQVLGRADGFYGGFSLSGGQNSWTGPRETGTGTGWGTGLSLWVLLKHPGYPQFEAILNLGQLPRVSIQGHGSQTTQWETLPHT